MKKAKQKPNGAIWLDDANLARTKMQAIEVAARFPEATSPHSAMMGGGYPGTPGKSAEKVILDAEKIIAFVTKR